MAIEYSLALGCQDSPLNFSRFLEERGPGLRESVDHPGVLVGDGLVCWIFAQSSLGRGLIDEKFGITTDLDILCRVDKFELYPNGMDTLIRICMVVLTDRACDMVLLANGEKGLLLRRRGETVVACSDPYWQTAWRSAFSDVGIPLKCQDLPTL